MSGTGTTPLVTPVSYSFFFSIDAEEKINEDVLHIFVEEEEGIFMNSQKRLETLEGSIWIRTNIFRVLTTRITMMKTTSLVVPTMNV